MEAGWPLKAACFQSGPCSHPPELHFPWGPGAADFRRECGSAHAAAVRLTLRSHGGRLRLRFRGLRRREAGPRAHNGAGESADRRGQRAGAATEDDGQVLPEVYREAGGFPGQFGAEVHRHVHGPLHGRLEHRVTCLQLAAAAGTSQHVTATRLQTNPPTLALPPDPFPYTLFVRRGPAYAYCLPEDYEDDIGAGTVGTLPVLSA